MHTDVCGCIGWTEMSCEKEAKKKLKYKSLSVEIERTWNMRCVTIPAIVEAIGIVTKRLRKKFGSRTGKTVNRFGTSDSCTWNITRNIEGTAL